jgi:HEPN domain-containing protein
MKTAVEFYREELNALVSLRETKFKTEQEIFEQAKAMEKEQIKDAYLNGRYEADKIVMGHSFYAKQYYNETFKQQEQ